MPAVARPKNMARGRRMEEVCILAVGSLDLCVFVCVYVSVVLVDLETELSWR
jgi:hypothetical protein